MFRLSRLVHYAISPFSRIRPTLVCVTEKFVAIAAPLEPFASHPFACVLMRSDPVGFAPNTYFQRASSCRKRSNTAIDQKSTGLRPCLTRLRFRLKSLRCSLVLTDIPVRMLRSLGRSHACRIMLRNLSTAVLRLADCVRCSDTCMTRYCSLLTR
jgi:hypothetical protein